ncbi:MAG: hypothetical protein GOV15_04610, partial [Candidatus Diapherotrites archaeon]|nr:hypothetical protein [Candidatus Diapherotrites archaeon]
GNNFSTWSYAWDTSALNDGSRSITVESYDTAGFSQAVVVTVTLENVNAKPVVSITSPSIGGNAEGTITVTGTATDADTANIPSHAVSSVEVKLNDGAWVPATINGTTWSSPVTLPARTSSNQAVTIYARGTDSASLVSDTASVSITVLLLGDGPLGGGGSGGGTTPSTVNADAADISIDNAIKVATDGVNGDVGVLTLAAELEGFFVEYSKLAKDKLEEANSLIINAQAAKEDNEFIKAIQLANQAVIALNEAKALLPTINIYSFSTFTGTSSSESEVQSVLNEAEISDPQKKALALASADLVSVKRTVNQIAITQENVETDQTTVVLEVTNYGPNDLIDLSLIEVIPKSFATDVSELNLSTGVLVLKADPVIQWVIGDLEVGETAKFIYSKKENQADISANDFSKPVVLVSKVITDTQQKQSLEDGDTPAQVDSNTTSGQVDAPIEVPVLPDLPVATGAFLTNLPTLGDLLSGVLLLLVSTVVAYGVLMRTRKGRKFLLKKRRVLKNKLSEMRDDLEKKKITSREKKKTN